MPGLPMLPDTAPFPAEQITALNRIMSATNAATVGSSRSLPSSRA